MGRAVRMGLAVDREPEVWEKQAPEMVRHLTCCSYLFFTFEVTVSPPPPEKKGFLVSIYIARIH